MDQNAEAWEKERNLTSLITSILFGLISEDSAVNLIIYKAKNENVEGLSLTLSEFKKKKICSLNWVILGGLIHCNNPLAQNKGMKRLLNHCYFPESQDSDKTQHWHSKFHTEYKDKI